MTACTYLKRYDGEDLACPESEPNDARCSLCLLLLLLDKNRHTQLAKPDASKLPT